MVGLKANSGGRKKKSKLVVSILLVAVIIVLLAIIGLRVYDEVRFNSMLPDPDAATHIEMGYRQEGSAVFLSKGACVASYCDGGDFLDTMILCRWNADALFVNTCDINAIQEMKKARESFTVYEDSIVKSSAFKKIYLPAGASDEFMNALKTEVFPESEIIRLKRAGEKFVVGEFVVRVLSVNDYDIAFTVTHGNNNFLVAQSGNHKLSALKNKSIEAAFASYGAIKDFSDINYLVLPAAKWLYRDNGFTKEDEISLSYSDLDTTLDTVCVQYFDMENHWFVHGLHTGEEIEFDTSFTPTGKIR